MNAKPPYIEDDTMNWEMRLQPTQSGEAAHDLDAAYIEKSGLSVELLMESAAAAAFHFIERRYPDIRSVLLLAGSGHNGGDAWALARQLSSLDLDILILDFAPDREFVGANQRMRLAAQKLRLPITEVRTEEDFPKVKKWDLVVEGLLGTGYRAQPLRELYREGFAYAEKLRARGASLISLDVPGGVDASTGAAADGALRADLTLCFDRAKSGLFVEPGVMHGGELVTLSIGYPLHLAEREGAELDFRVMTESALAALLPKRSPFSHKSDYGRAFLLAGSPSMPGGLILASRACLSVGPGFLSLGIDSELKALLPSLFPQCLYPGREVWQKQIREADAVAAGPAWGRSEEKKILLREALLSSRKLILDADALNLLSADPELMELCRSRGGRYGSLSTLLTPHPGEFLRLFPEWEGRLSHERLEAVRSAAVNMDAMILLKGACSLLACPNRHVLAFRGMNSALAKAGSGDVLSGLILAFAAQMDSLFEAAASAAELHLLSARKLSASSGTAGVSIAELPFAATDILRRYQDGEDFVI